MSAVVISLPLRGARTSLRHAPGARTWMSRPGPGAGHPGDGGGRVAAKGEGGARHLRLVREPVAGGADGEVVPAGTDLGAGLSPSRYTTLPRRPGVPLAVRARADRLERVSPRHPAVRAARRRRQERSAEAGAASRRAGGQVGPSESATSRRRPVARHGCPAAGSVRLSRPVLRGGVRALVTCLAVLLLAGALAGTLAGRGLVPVAAAGGTSAGSPDRVTTTVVVQAGQTLWELASETGGRDTAETVEEIVELNDLHSPTLHPGQRLVVPAY